MVAYALWSLALLCPLALQADDATVATGKWEVPDGRAKMGIGIRPWSDSLSAGDRLSLHLNDRPPLLSSQARLVSVPQGASVGIVALWLIDKENEAAFSRLARFQRIKDQQGVDVRLIDCKSSESDAMGAVPEPPSAARTNKGVKSLNSIARRQPSRPGLTGILVVALIRARSRRSGSARASESKLDEWGDSDIGKVRDENQDDFRLARVAQGHLYVVADGMGGHRGGRSAAKQTVETVCEFLARLPASAEIESALVEAIQAANNRVYKHANDGDERTAGMGSTIVAMLIAGNRMHIAHVGDSRAYRYRRNRLEQLTRDHTVVQRLVDEKMITETEAKDHPSSNVLSRAIGHESFVSVDLTSDELREGDVYLLCSDGLTGTVDASAIASCVRSHQTSSSQIVENLIELANAQGGDDNVTVVAVRHGIRSSSASRRKSSATKASAALAAISVIALTGILLTWYGLLKINNIDADMEKMKKRLDTEVPQVEEIMFPQKSLSDRAAIPRTAKKRG